MIPLPMINTDGVVMKTVSDDAGCDYAICLRTEAKSGLLWLNKRAKAIGKTAFA